MIDNENGFENLEKTDWEQLIDSFDYSCLY